LRESGSSPEPADSSAPFSCGNPVPAPNLRIPAHHFLAGIRFQPRTCGFQRPIFLREWNRTRCADCLHEPRTRLPARSPPISAPRPRPPQRKNGKSFFVKLAWPWLVLYYYIFPHADIITNNCCMTGQSFKSTSNNVYQCKMTRYSRHDVCTRALRRVTDAHVRAHAWVHTCVCTRALQGVGPYLVMQNILLLRARTILKTSVLPKATKG
jgi:hypothetical protein